MLNILCQEQIPVIKSKIKTSKIKLGLNELHSIFNGDCSSFLQVLQLLQERFHTLSPF